MALNDDAPRRLKVVRAEPKKPEQRSPNAEAAARYRARQRGQEVPKRKPGPKPPRIMELRQQIRELETRLQVQELHRRIAEERLARRGSALTIEQVAGELLTVLRRDHARIDTAEQRVLLRDLAVEIEDRHEHWPE